MADSTNPLLRDRDVEFLLYELLDAPSLCAAPAFAEHSPRHLRHVLASTRRLARGGALPGLQADGRGAGEASSRRIVTHPRMKGIWKQLVELGVVNATRPAEVGGQQLPLTVATLAHAYLMAGNLSAYGFVGLTTGAAHLLEAFGDEFLKRELMARLYRGENGPARWPSPSRSGSSLSDVTTARDAAPDGCIESADRRSSSAGAIHDLTENVVQHGRSRASKARLGDQRRVALRGAAAPGSRRRGSRERAGAEHLHVAVPSTRSDGLGSPAWCSISVKANDCRGWLVGEAHKAFRYMFPDDETRRASWSASTARHRVGRVPRGSRVPRHAPARSRHDGA